MLVCDVCLVPLPSTLEAYKASELHDERHPLAGSTYYNRVLIELDKGERCFSR